MEVISTGFALSLMVLAGALLLLAQEKSHRLEYGGSRYFSSPMNELNSNENI